MQKLILNEILWEFCPNCNKNCEYCGSRELLNKYKELKEGEIDLILGRIIAYPPKSVTLTGGEPTISKYFERVVHQLFLANIPVKVVSNGTIFLNGESTLSEIQQIGYSVNTEEDMAEGDSEADINSPKYISKAFKKRFSKKITMITNFGNHNIWIFDKLYNYFREMEFSCWQIQLTMGKYQLNEDGIEFLRNKIEKLNPGNPSNPPYQENLFKNNLTQTIVLSDNLQYSHECQAGLSSCGITWDGKVVPCLSERAWLKNLRYQGDLLDPEQSLKQIWEQKFSEIRFKDCKCCRDCIKYPYPLIKTPLNIILEEQELTYPKYIPSKKRARKQPIVVVYSVAPADPPVVAYGVFPNITMYGVTEPNSYMYGVWTKTSTSSNIEEDKNGKK